MSAADALDYLVLGAVSVLLPLGVGTMLGQAIMRRRARTR